jgi:antitoxin (DNA-binding transcriptional repressor) of toxin-antitoxin stability system
MQTYNIHEAKMQPSKLIEMASSPESFVIAKAGKTMVKVTALNTPEPSQMRWFGFMAEQAKVPGDFNTTGADDMKELFEGKT